MNKLPFDQIKKHYEALTPFIIGRSKHGSWADIYNKDIDFTALMTPIEYEVWGCLRSCGKLPMYPQYPVGKYFSDFGNPHLKVAIECDGQAYHKDKEKDRLRDIEFKKLGWNVYRVTGSECKKLVNINEPDIDMEYKMERKLKLLEEFYNTTGEGLVCALALIHYGEDPSVGLTLAEEMEDDFCAEYTIAKKCLKKWESDPLPLK